MDTKQTFTLTLILVLFLYAPHVSGQQHEFTLVGSVTDSFTGEAVDSCLVTVWNSDSTSIIGSTLNAGWGFRMGIPASGEYILCYSHPRYISFERHLKLKFSRNRRPRITLDPAKLRKKPKMTADDYIYKTLEDVVVTASKIKMVLRGDTVVYNADAFELANGSMLDALVRLLPGVELKGNQIYVNGEFVENLLVNGRNFFRGNPKIALDNLPAYMVDKVKVYRRDSNSDAALGIQRINSRDKALVMDVGLKRVYSFGWTVSADAGVGTDNRYLGKLFGIRFSDYTHSVAFINSNNTNDATMPGTSGQWNSQYNLTVPSSYISAGLMHTIDDRLHRFTYEGELSFDYNSQDIHTRQSSDRFLSPGDTYSRLRSVNENKATHMTTRHNLELKRPGSGYYIIIKPRMEYTSNRSDMASWYAEQSTPIVERNGSVIDSIFFISNRKYDQQPFLISTQDIINHTNGHMWNAGIDAGVSFKISELGDVLHLNLSGNFADGRTQSKEFNQVKFHQSSVSPNTQRNTQNEIFLRNASSVISADCPVTWNNVSGWQLTIVPSFTFNMEYNHAPRTIYLMADSVNQTRQALDVINSYHSSLYTYTCTPGIRLNMFRQMKSGHRISISAGTSVRTEDSRLKYQRDIIDTCLMRLFVYAEPQLHIGYEKPNEWILQFEYDMKQQAPELIDFIPYRDNTNPLVVSVGGNADMKGMLSHTMSLYYRNMDFRSRKMIAASLAASFQPRQVTRAVNYDSSTGVQTVSLMNLRGRNALSGMINYRAPFTEKPCLYANASAQLNYSSSTEFVNNKRTVNTLMPSESLYVSYEKSNTRIEIGAAVEYAHVTSDDTGFQPFNCINLTYGVEGRTLLPYKIEFSMDAKVYTRRGYHDETMNTDRLVVGTSLSRGLFSDRLLMRLSIYDLFGKLDSVTRTINAYGRTEIWQNTMGRYAMFSIQYRFNKQPKKRQ